jgi:hypothetical protein
VATSTGERIGLQLARCGDRDCIEHRTEAVREPVRSITDHINAVTRNRLAIHESDRVTARRFEVCVASSIKVGGVHLAFNDIRTGIRDDRVLCSGWRTSDDERELQTGRRGW